MDIEPANNLHLLKGCYPPECGADGPFVWAPSRFEIFLPRSTHAVGLDLAYLGENGAIRLLRDDACVDKASLREGWQECTLSVPDGTDRLRLEVGPLRRVQGDDRELGVMIRRVTLLEKSPHLALRRSVAENAVLNDTEYRTGRSRLASYPPYLRVTSEVRCNIPETSQACTYCAWDWAKSMERESPTFSPDTLDELGGFYAKAHSIGDCSIGEPTMNRRLGEVLSRFDKDGKRFSFTTNGQLLVERTRQQLLGKDIDVYVSIDSASAQGFKRYRDDRFEKIIANLRLLCSDKRRHHNLPKVIASFIAMRSNVEEIEPYIELMKDVGVDFIKLRSLYLDDNVAPVVTNNGYRFEYYSEVLSCTELADFATRARSCAARNDLPVYVEWEQFEPKTKTEGQPLCAEPWKTLYVLARGIMPCAYATEPLAKWQEQGDQSLEEFLRDVFNSDEYQSLRGELAAGRLAPYCLNTPSCPVLKRRADECAGSDAKATTPPVPDQ
jgi:MoaA/NifB/PqqE/SkfB family radical SAM enzyme